MNRSLLTAFGVTAALLPTIARAQRTLTIGIGSDLTFEEIAVNIMFYMAAVIGFVAVAMFMVGALMMVLGGVKEEMRDGAKKLIFGSIIGMGVVLGSYAIVRTVYYFLFSV
jgi:hypothetical protein